MDPLIPPRAHTRSDQEIDLIPVAAGVLFQKFESTVYAARFVAVHTAGDQDERLVVPPVAVADREQRIAIGGIV